MIRKYRYFSKKKGYCVLESKKQKLIFKHALIHK